MGSETFTMVASSTTEARAKGGEGQHGKRVSAAPTAPQALDGTDEPDRHP
jgi:hypothetical protein